MNEPPSWDPVRGRLRVSPRQLSVLAGLLSRMQPDAEDAAARELVAAGLLSNGGTLSSALRAVAAAAADARAQVAVTRLTQRGDVRVGITWGESGVVVMRMAGANQVSDVVVQPPTRLARTVWRILQLGPRPSASNRRTIEVDADALLAAIDGRAAAWTESLCVDPVTMVLNRLDVVANAEQPPASWAVLDAGTRGLWKVTAPGKDGPLTFWPTSSAEAYAEIAALQPVSEVVK